VRVRDFENLKGLACDCNEQVRRHFDDVLRGVYPTPEESAAQKEDASDGRPGSRMPA